MGSWGMGTPVEIEFAVNMSAAPGKLREFGLLQMRPLVLSREFEELNVDNIEPEKLICQSHQVLGNGVISELRDIVVVDIHRFDRSKSRDVAKEVSQFNEKLINEHRPYLLVGVGRWGTLDPWLGIPVKWDQISGAKAIVESGFKDFAITPSQGSHFFQNITSFLVGYFTINSHMKQGFIDWDWLSQQEAVEEKEFTRHIRLKNPVVVKINGHKNMGVILKPEDNSA
jgi:hypothetical protein